MSEEIWLSCRDIERYLGEEDSRVHALRGVSLDLEPATVHAVVGPSGCGKSTLLYILGLLDSPDAGSLTISGTVIADLPDDELTRKRNELLGFIFQFHFLLEDFSAQENVMIPMRRLGRLSEEAMRERAALLLEEVGLGNKLSRPSRHLSGGEQQRVAVARALANNPRVILADEPTGNLDTANSERAFRLLQRIVRDERKALLLVTHNPAIAEACDWIHEMQDGLIVGSHPRGSERPRHSLGRMRPASPILPPAEVRPVVAEMAGAVDHGAELKRGMFFNTIALLASNFRGVFTFLIARLLGRLSLGVFLVAWATTDVLSKIGDVRARQHHHSPLSRGPKPRASARRSRALFHLAVFLAVAQSALVAALAI